MGLFNKLKNIFQNKEKEINQDENIEKYDKGLEKTRNEFV